MPLIVPILRLSMLFLNVFETFKTMKPPMPSARRGGQPSVRAITQRKRDMKGCLAVWIVWCCLAAYERMFEGFVCFLVPFYNEIKSIVLFFLLVTRARGAEPIYLHLIRPLIKPYVSTIDSLLDLARMFGDIFFFLSATPLQHVQSWWSVSLWDVQEIETDGPDSDMYGSQADPIPDASAYPVVVPQMSASSPSSLVDRQQPIPRIDCVQKSSQDQHVPSEMGNSKEHLLEAPVRTRHRSLKTSIASTTAPAIVAPSTSQSGRKSDGRVEVDERNGLLRPLVDPPKPHESQVYRWQLREPNSTAPISHEIWHPPLSAYEGSVDNSDVQPERSGARQPSYHSSATADTTPPHAEPGTAGILEVDEWRLYPPFPSAYPPTPLPASVKLPSTTPKSMISTSSRRPSDKVQFPPIKEENEHSFCQSLMPREPSNPSSDLSIGDDKISSTGVQNHDSSSSEESMDVDSDDEDSDDSFNITLRTPRRKRTAKLPFQKSQSQALSSTSAASSSRLSTVGNASTLRTRSNSESSSTMSSSDASSVVGHKRSFREVDEIDLQKTIKPAEKIRSTQFSKSGKVSSHHTASCMLPVDTSASPAVDENESEHGDGLGTKRRRVAKTLREGSGSSSSNLSLVPPKNDGVREQATTEGPPPITKSRGKGRSLAPSRSSSRIANSQTAPRISRLAPTSSNSSQSTVTSTSVQTGTAIPPLRDRNMRNRT